jgi:hypothetical protein
LSSAGGRATRPDHFKLVWLAMRATRGIRLVGWPQRLFRGEDFATNPLGEVLLLDDVVRAGHELVDQILNPIQSYEDFGGGG